MKHFLNSLLIEVLAWSFVSTPLVAAQAPSSPTGTSTERLLTVVVLDTSGSMQGKRLDAAKKELIQHAKALPPSPDTPWVFLPFNDKVYATRTFTNGLPGLETYVSGLEADGGTSIASGLKAALKVIRNSNAQRVNILLYTDGEDGDDTGIEEQQEQLGKLFDERHDRGLGQAVICRRWEGANKALVSHLEKKKSVQVIDAGEARLISLVLTPVLRVVSCRWIPDRHMLEICFEAHVQAPPELVRECQPLPLHFECMTPAQGDLAFDVPIGVTHSAQHKITMPLEPDPTLSNVTLDFKVTPPSVKQVAKALVYPSLATDRLIVVAPIPIVYVTATTLAVTPPRWTDLAHAVASFEATVRVRVDGPLRNGTILHLVSPPGVRSAECRPAVLRPGEQTVTIALQAVLRPRASTTYAFSLNAHPAQSDWHLVSKPLAVSVVGPAPLRIALSQDGQVAPTIEANLPGDSPAAPVLLRPVILGASGPVATKGVIPVARASGAFEFDQEPHLEFSRRTTVRMRARAGMSQRSFVRDLLIEGTVTTSTVHNMPCVVGTTQKVVLRSEAPLKRLLFMASIALFVLVVLFVLGRFFWKMSIEQDPA